MTTQKLSSRHVVFGAGAVGSSLAAVLVRRGIAPDAVTLVSRTGAAPATPGVTVRRGDVADRGTAVAAARGADVVYQVLNPPYHRWAQEFPTLEDNVVAAAEAAGARLVVLENVYGYGHPVRGEAFTEESPLKPASRKGEVRVAMHERLLAAQRAGRVEIAVGRASDYYGPGSGRQSPIGDEVVAAALANGRAKVVGDPDQPHTYSWIPDIAEGLATLGTHPAAAGRVWHLPNDPDTRTTRGMIDDMFRLAGHGPARLQKAPAWLLRAIGLRQPAAAEIVEMLYEFREPFVVDSSRITRELGVTATPYGTALARTMQHAQTVRAVA